MVFVLRIAEVQRAPGLLQTHSGIQVPPSTLCQEAAAFSWFGLTRCLVEHTGKEKREIPGHPFQLQVLEFPLAWTWTWSNRELLCPLTSQNTLVSVCLGCQ